jgi:uncharacterized repeat protein (TIGR01451 family)
MSPIVRRARKTRARTRWTTAAFALAVSAAVGVLWPLTATADHAQPTLPLTAPIVQAASACNGAAGTSIPTGTQGNATTAPDRNNTSSSNEHTAGTAADFVIHANAESDPKENTLDISGSHNVFDGLIDTRSHLKLSGSWNLLRHGTEYGQRSVSGKVAFDLTGSNNCFSPIPNQEYENAPPASPAGFPLAGDFDPDQDGNILEHFAPGTAPALAAMGDATPGPQYFVCGIPDPDGPANGAATAPGCSGSGASAIMDRNVQGQQIERGLYFVTGRVKLSASNLNATLTVVSGQQLNVNGSFQGQGVNVFNPYTDASGAIIGGLLFASQWDEAAPLSGPTFPDGGTANDSPNTDKAEDALKIEGSLSRFEGIIVATNGRTEVAGEQLDFRCPVMGDRVRVNGSKNYFNAAGCVANPNIQVSKTPDGGVTVNAGDDATFTITVTNNGSGPATNVDIDDVFPGTGWTLVSAKKAGVDLPAPPPEGCAITGGNTLHCDVASLAPGESIVVIVKRATTTADCAGDTGSGIRLDNGSLTSDPSDDALADADNSPQDNDPGHLFVRCPDVSVQKTPDEPDNNINAGDTATFTITWTNHGPGTATGIGTNPPSHDVLPAGLTWTESGGDPDGKCAVASNVLTCSGITLANGASYSVSVSATTSHANCGQLNNTVTLTANGDANPNNNTNSGEIDVVCPDVTVIKSPDEPNNNVNVGSNASFTILFRNLGPGPATGVGTNPPNHDVLPAGLTWAESGGDPDGRCSVASNVLTCAGISLAAPNAGDTDEYSVTVSAPTTSANCGQLDNTVVVTANGDTNPANNSDSAEVDVICGALQITKTAKHVGAGSPNLQATFTIVDANGSSRTLTTNASGVGCIDGLAIGQTQSIIETIVPLGYQAPTIANVNVPAGTCGANGLLATGGVVVNVENKPLTDVTISINSQVPGATSTTVTCDNPATQANPDFTFTTPSAGDGSLSISNVPAPPNVTLNCTIVIDP